MSILLFMYVRVHMQVHAHAFKCLQRPEGVADPLDWSYMDPEN